MTILATHRRGIANAAVYGLNCSLETVENWQVSDDLKRTKPISTGRALLLMAAFVLLVVLMRDLEHAPPLSADANPGVSSHEPASGPVIRVPAEPQAVYTAELVTKMTDGLAHIVTKRVGPAGTTFTKRECRCGAATVRTLGAGETLDQMQSSPMDPKHSGLVTGASAFHACEYACAAIGSRLDRSKIR